MPAGPLSHPDRSAATLADLLAADRLPAAGAFAPPGAGSADCRIDLKLLQWRAEAAAAASARARAHLAALPRDRHPDLWAGTVRDGTARGFAVRLEEAIAMADLPPSPAPLATRAGARTTTGKELRRRKDLLVASGGARMRWSRREGLLFVDRDGGLHSANCVRFEARTDQGTLDGFAGAADERPRLYSAQFLQPRLLVEAGDATELTLAGRLGRGPVGWDVELVVSGDPADLAVGLRLRLDQRQTGWRLRVRFLGIPATAILHACTPVTEVVANDAGGFVAMTLVRAAGVLLVDGAPVAVPGGNCQGPIEHTFRLGLPPPRG